MALRLRNPVSRVSWRHTHKPLQITPKGMREINIGQTCFSPPEMRTRDHRVAYQHDNRSATETVNILVKKGLISCILQHIIVFFLFLCNYKLCILLNSPLIIEWLVFPSNILHTVIGIQTCDCSKTTYVVCIP